MDFLHIKERLVFASDILLPYIRVSAHPSTALQDCYLLAVYASFSFFVFDTAQPSSAADNFSSASLSHITSSANNHSPPTS
jgi:hypothetical protein